MELVSSGIATYEVSFPRRASWITGANIVVDGGQGYPSARRFAAP